MKVKSIAYSGVQVLIRIRNVTFILLALLIPQFWLGMTINLEVNIPVKNLNAIGSLTYYGEHFPLILIHILNGFLILTVSVVLLLLSLRTEYKSIRILSIIIMTSVIGAIVNGILFLESGQFFGWSIGMAMSAVSALVLVAIILYFIGKNLANN